MKIARRSQGKNSPRFMPPPIPLERDETNTTLKKGEYADFKLLVNPEDEDSAEYTLSLPYFSKGGPEDWLIFRRTLNKVFRGLNIKSGKNAVPIVNDLLSGEPLRVFTNKIKNCGEPTTMNDITKALNAVTMAIFPHRSLARQRRYMRRYMRKPVTMKVRSYISRVFELNELLKEFPPFDEDQEIEEDDLIELIDANIPNTWQQHMVLQDFDPVDHTLQEFIEFCERLEVSEEMDPRKNQNSGKNSETASSTGETKKGAKAHAKSSEEAQNSKSKSKNSSKTPKWCHLHQTSSHDSNECKVLLGQADKMRGMWEAAKNGKPTHKTAKHKNDAGKKHKANALTEHLHALSESIKEAIGAKNDKKDKRPNKQARHDKSVSSDKDKKFRIK